LWPNDVTAPDAGFAADTNKVTLLSNNGTVKTLPLMSKLKVAEAVFNQLMR